MAFPLPVALKRTFAWGNQANRPRNVRCRPILEVLEDRTAPAVDLVVTSLLDAPDADPMDGTAASTLPGGEVTLRSAIMHANQTIDEDFRILLPAGIIQLTIPVGESGPAEDGDLDIRRNLTIQGQAGSGVSATGIGDRVFDIFEANVIFNDFLITGGSSFEGGGIRSLDSNLILTRVHVTGNQANAVSEFGGEGGGIHFLAFSPDFSLTILDSAITSNTADRTGGGIFLQGNGFLQNVTVSNNTGTDFGGGIFLSVEGSTLRLNHVTIAENGSIQGGGGLNNASAQVFLGSTILADNSGGNYSGSQATSLGFNLDTDGSANLNGTGDLIASANLGALDNNGGPTPTHALLAGSPALDAAGPDGFPAADQRGVPRPINLVPDIGAYEAGPLIVVGGSVDVELDGVTQVFTWQVIDPKPMVSPPITEVSVFRDGILVFTSADPVGQFNFDALGLGIYFLQVIGFSADGTGSSQERQVQVVDDDTEGPTILLAAQNGTFLWNVSDASLPLAAVEVTVTRNGAVVFGSGAAQGAFDFGALGVGTYVLTVQAVDGDNDWEGDASANQGTLSAIVPVVSPPANGVDPPVLTAPPVFPGDSFVPTGDPTVFLVFSGQTGTPVGLTPPAPGVDFLFALFGVPGSAEETALVSAILNQAFRDTLVGAQEDRIGTPGQSFSGGLPSDNPMLRGIYPSSDPVGAILSPLDADDSVRLVELLLRRAGRTPSPSSTGTTGATDPTSNTTPPPGPASLLPAPTPEESEQGRNLVPLLPLAAGGLALGKKKKRGRPRLHPRRR